MILFVEHEPQRAVLAFNRMTVEDRNNTMWCQTAAEAIEAIWSYRDVLTKVSLDHDLGGREYTNTKREDCGMEIVRFLEKKSHKEPVEFKKLESILFVIHSWNDHAGPIMQRRLSNIGLNAVYIPFGM